MGLTVGGAIAPRPDAGAFIALLLVGGAIGGVAAWLSDRAKLAAVREAKQQARVSLEGWYSYVIGGVVASFAVPLFLRLTSSELVDHVLSPASEGARVSDSWVLLGFCLVAGFSSKAFMQGLSQRIQTMAAEAKKQAEAAREDSQDAQTAADQALEAVENDGEVNIGAPVADPAALPPPGLSSDEQKVWRAIEGSSYTRRTATGISRDSGLDKVRARSVAERMASQGTLRSQVSKKTGNTLYSLIPGV